MVKLIIGSTGSGKTKELIDQVNIAVQNEKGSVVCIAAGSKLTFDIPHDARLIDASEYNIKSYDALQGFLSGIHAGNYDITSIFIDGLYKIVGSKDATMAEAFLGQLSEMSDKHGYKVTIALSEDNGVAADVLKKYL